jgi:hypothetical protein
MQPWLLSTGQDNDQISLSLPTMNQLSLFVEEDNHQLEICKIEIHRVHHIQQNYKKGDQQF